MSLPPREDPRVTVEIVFPPHSSNVPGGGTFVTYGRVEPTNADKSAWVMDGTTKITGKATDPPENEEDPYDWAFAFKGVPTGHVVQLTVKVELGQDNASKTIDITCVQ